jgi:hypothetical protein
VGCGQHRPWTTEWAKNEYLKLKNVSLPSVVVKISRRTTGNSISNCYFFNLVIYVRGSHCDYSLTTGANKPSYATYHKKVVLNCLEASLAWADWIVLRETQNNRGASWYVD